MGPLTVGEKAPDFTVKGVLQEKIATYSLRDYRGKWIVLFFYPADFFLNAVKIF